MDDYYHQFLTSMTGVPARPTPNIQDIPTSSPQQVAPHAVPMANPYSSLEYFTGFPEPIMFNAPKSQRNRRKSSLGLEHVKHRRTRSGCFTCRSRRVKVAMRSCSP